MWIQPTVNLKSIFAFPTADSQEQIPAANQKCCLDCMRLNLWMQMAAVKSKVTLVFLTGWGWCP